MAAKPGQCDDKHGEVMALVDERIRACKTSVTDDIHEIRVFVDEVRDAFVKDDQGNPDFFGHYSDHYTRMQAAKAEKQFWDTAKQESVKNGVSTLITIIKVALVLAVLGLAYKLGWVKP
jgi:hypothetical protein